MDAVAAALNASPVPLDLAVLLLALLLDLTLGEPPNRLHPTVWMGQTVSLAGRIAPGPQRSPAGQLLAGLLMALLLPAAWGALAWAIAAGLLALHPLAYLIVAAALLKTAFSVRMLRRVAAGVGRLLAAGDLAAARREMSALVSRDAACLTAGQMAAAAIESVAENITDSVVAPLLAFALFGLPGAAAYRALNTLDSMVGYHGRYEYLGKASARLDDLANLLPARLAALLLCLAIALLPGMSGPPGLPRNAGAPPPHRIPQRRLDDGGNGRRPGRNPGQNRPLPPRRPGPGAGGAPHRAGHPGPVCRHRPGGHRRRRRHTAARRHVVSEGCR